MSQVNSDDMFDEVGGGLIVPGEDDGVDMMPEQPMAAPPRPAPSYSQQGFNIYTMLLLLSFLFLLTATILFFSDAGSY